MKESLFREKSLDRLSSPEDLNKYMRVVSPAVWMAVVAVVLVVFSAIVWGTVWHVESTVPCLAVGANGEGAIYVSERYAPSVQPGQTIRVGESEYVLGEIGAEPVPAEETLSEYALSVGGFSEGEFVYRVGADGFSQTGSFGGEIVTESVSALSFLWN